MPLAVWSLASGSSGNCMWIEGRSSALLLDAGLSASTLVERLHALRRDPCRLLAVLLTHEHADHSLGALAIARRLRVPIISTAATLSAVTADCPEVPTAAYPSGTAFSIGEFRVASFPVQHDAADPVGYQVACGRSRMCTVTDTGVVTPAIRQAMDGCQLVILESNHDIARLRRGPYPEPLKQRILSDYGHLSNDDAAAAVASLSRGNSPVCVWLAHLSATNNTPKLAINSVRYALRFARPDRVRVAVALRDRVSVHWSSENNWWQMNLWLS
ncbi:MAG: MBL fold metallo-hydrolase [Armatimonadota bacterium]